MESYRKEINSYSHSHSNSNPSFSSTLLDAIYRSIDEGEQGNLLVYKEAMKKKQHSAEEMANFQRACMIEKWMEKKSSSEKVPVRRKSMADFERKSLKNSANSMLLNSSSSSSDSSCGGGFSSSEAESVHVVSSRASSCYGLQKPKPIRTSVNSVSEKEKTRKYDHKVFDDITQQKNEGGGFMRTKSKALKIYGDLKKVKQPISPGGKLASFLNSLFTAGNAKKSKVSSSSRAEGLAYDDRLSSTVKSANASTCSSASSFSRSCLSKTPSSRGKSSNGTKRSVRFYPVSIIVDEDCQPCGQKSLHEDKQNLYVEPVKSRITSSIDDELMVHVMENNRRVEEAARDLLRNYQKKVENEFDLRKTHVKDQVFDQDLDEDEDEEDDDASCASSDLFELDNLSAIGMEMYREELPVYETTHLDTNRAIANGLIV